MKTALKGYKVSKDYKRLKELLDNGYTVVVLWVHDTTGNVFAGIAKRVPPVKGGVEGNWYSLDSWNYFPTIEKKSFEEKCESIGFSFIEPDEPKKAIGPDDKSSRAADLIDECNKNINDGEVNSFGSYDEGARDALMWVYENGPEPYIGRED